MSRLSKNIIYNFIGQGLLLILGFVAVKYIFKQLGEDALGIIYFTVMLNSLASVVLEMGICATTVREVAGCFEEEPAYISELIRTFSLFFWSAYVLISFAVYVLAPVMVEKWINLTTMDAATAIYVLRILGITSLVALPKSLYVSLFRGLQRMEFNNIIDVVTSGLQQFGIILILALGGNLFKVVYWFAACYLLRILIYLVCSAHFFSPRALVPGYSLAVVKRNIGYSLKMMSLSFLLAIHKQADKVIVSKLLSIGTFGYYSFAYSSVSRGALVTGAIAQAAFPYFSALSQKGDRNRLITQYHKLQDLLCFATVPLFAAIPFASLPLFSYLFNEQVARMLLLPITLLCVSFYMNGTLRMASTFTVSTGKPEIVVKLNSFALFILLPITIVLIYQFGLTGAALSWVFYYIFAYVYAVPRICVECLKIPTEKWYLQVLRIFLLICFTYGLAGAVLHVLDNSGILSLSLAYIGGSTLFLIGAYFMIGGELRETIVSHLQIFRNNIKVKAVTAVHGRSNRL
jgi:O-antigen/teichoic acid export membrane protein